MNNRCSMPFNGLTVIDLSNYTMSPCCKIPSMKFEPKQGIITPELLELRNTIIRNERHQSCIDSGCWAIDDAGGPSMRKKHHSYSAPLNWETVDVNAQPEKVIIIFSNKCQMMCTYCGPSASSMWEQKIYSKIPIKEERIKLTELLDITSLKEIAISGGEPMLDDDCISFLMNLDFDPARKLNLVTNLSYGPAVFAKLLKIIERHPNIFISCSLDSINDATSRTYLNLDLWHKNFQILVDNLQLRKKIYTDVWIEIKAVLGVFNYKTIQSLIEFVLDFRKRNLQGVTFNINPLAPSDPNSLTSGVLDIKIKITLLGDYDRLLSRWERLQIETTNKLLETCIYRLPG